MVIWFFDSDLAYFSISCCELCFFFRMNVRFPPDPRIVCKTRSGRRFYSFPHLVSSFWKLLINESSDVACCFQWWVVIWPSCVSCLDLDGGLEELVDEFNSSLIMYAFVRVVDPKTSLPKFVIVNWVSEWWCARRLIFYLLYSNRCDCV